MTAPRNVVVTGGAGYVGSHTCKALSRAGFQPIVFDNLSNGHEWAVKWGPLVQGDVHDTGLLAEVIKSVQPCAVMHFAAYIEVGESVKDPLRYYHNNVSGTLSLLNAMQAAKVGKFIFSSTCALYGMFEGAFLIETCPQNPISPYAHSKHVVEQILADLAAHGKLDYVALRYFNASGADPDGEIGEAHSPETHLVPLAIFAGMNAKKGAAPLKVFGTDFPTPDGTAIRDYTHVCDLADAHVKALEHLLAGKPSDAFNLGSGQGHSVLEVLEGLRAIGLPVPAEKVGRRAGDPPRLVADASKANAVLGWRTNMSDLPTILSTALAWHRSQDVA
ncbi:MAG: UDP-glucose 4-epimerase GalE [Bdellovibrionales bacterium]